MKATRRQCLGLGAAALAAMGLAGCRSFEQMATAHDVEPPQMGTLTDALDLRLLQRATFGPTSFDLRRLGSLGPTGWLAEQMLPDGIDEPMVLTARVRSLQDITDADAGLLFDVDDHAAVRALTQETVLRAVYSRRQLYERMVNFWSDHFNIFAYKGEGPQYKVIDDRATIRPHAMGRFRDLLGASARSAAMLGFLDNAINRKGVPNENYARELLELHTMGVNSGYTQKDVQNVARCFTGWTLQRHWHRGAFQFDASQHDDGAKVVLGQMVLPGGGISDGDRVLDIVAAHPATARHITRKLCLYFLGDAPDALHARLAGIFQQSGGEIKPVLRELLSPDSLRQAKPMLKRPFDYAVSALRALGADTDGGSGIQSSLAAMGQSPFSWPMPDGYPLRDSAWVSGLIPRWQFAASLAGDRIDGTSVDWNAVESRTRALGADESAACADALLARPTGAGERFRLAVAQHGAGDMRRAFAVGLMSPEFQYH